MPNVSLTPEVEHFAEECIRSGRYSGLDEVARAALRLLQSAERRRRDFLDMLAEAEADGEAKGFATADQLAAELDTVIEASQHGKR